MTEQRDSLRRRIGDLVAGVPIINGDILLEIAHRLIYGYGYDDTLWPSTNSPSSFRTSNSDAGTQVG